MRLAVAVGLSRDFMPAAVLSVVLRHLPSRGLLVPMASMGRSQSRIFGFEELTVWRTSLPDVKFAVLPPSNNRPNPLATQERLYVSVFSPGAICALERDRGRLIWRRKLRRFADASVSLYGGKLFAKTANTLFALHPDSGETLWSFCPYGSDGESIYSSPSASDDRVYIGDRRGWLHCLDTESGRTIWKRRTNTARNCDVNSTPVLVHGLVIVSTNAGTAIAYETLSAKLVWRQKLDAPSIFGPLVHQGSVLAVSDSLYVVNPKTGKVRERFQWKEKRVSQVDSTPRGIVLTFSPTLPANRIRLPSGKAEAEKTLSQVLKSKTVMTFITQSGGQRTKELVAFCPSFRYAPATQLVYLSHLHGVDVFRPATGTLLCQLRIKDNTGNGIASVDTRDERIYALTGEGTVYALRQPAQP